MNFPVNDNNNNGKLSRKQQRRLRKQQQQQLAQQQQLTQQQGITARTPGTATATATATAEGEERDEFEDADEEVVYSNYQPAMLTIGHAHPDLLVQSSSLAAVLPPPITYELELSDELIESKALSSVSK